jgi:predicted acylesterase/phospholipase RssA
VLRTCYLVDEYGVAVFLPQGPIPQGNTHRPRSIRLSGPDLEYRLGMAAVDKPIIGLALGSGSARGWAHIGVIRALAEAGVQPDIGHIQDQDISALPLRFAAVATDLASGREVWLREGKVLDAVRASIALPGLFTPARRDGHWLVDGGLVNPVPVSLCRAMGAETVIAVDLNADIIGRHLTRRRPPVASEKTRAPEGRADQLRKRVQDSFANLQLPWSWREASDSPPSLFDTIATSLNIMQVHIGRSRLAGEPPELLITPHLAYLQLLEFHRAAEAIDEGKKATQAMLPSLRGAGLAV